MELRPTTPRSPLAKSKSGTPSADAEVSKEPKPKGLDAASADDLAARADAIAKNARSLIDPGKASDLVVGFESGDTNHPVVVGSLWNDADRPPAEGPGGLDRPGFFDGRRLDTADLADEQASSESDDADEVERPRFFDGRRLAPTDLEAEQKSDDD